MDHEQICLHHEGRYKIGQLVGGSVLLGFEKANFPKEYRALCHCGRIEARTYQAMMRLKFLCSVCRGGFCVTCGKFFKSMRAGPKVSCSPECGTRYRSQYFQLYKKAKYRIERMAPGASLEVDDAALRDMAILGSMMETNDE